MIGVEKRNLSSDDEKNKLWNRIVLIIFVDCGFYQIDNKIPSAPSAAHASRTDPSRGG